MDSSKVARWLGKNGGKKTFERYGKEHYVKMGKMSAEAKKSAKLSDSKLPIDN